MMTEYVTELNVKIEKYRDEPDYREFCEKVERDCRLCAKVYAAVGLILTVFPALWMLMFVAPATGISFDSLLGMGFTFTVFSAGIILLTEGYSTYTRRMELDNINKERYILEKRISELEKKLGDKP